MAFSMFYPLDSITFEEWNARLNRDLAALHSLGQIDLGRKIYYQNCQFYNTSSKVADYIEGWSSWVASYIRPCEEALFRGYIAKVSIQDTLDGIHLTKCQIINTLHIARRVLNNEITKSQIPRKNVEEAIEEIATHLDTAASGLKKLEQTYQHTAAKKQKLTPIINNFCLELKYTIGELRQKKASPEIKALVIPDEPLPSSNPEGTHPMVSARPRGHEKQGEASPPSLKESSVLEPLTSPSPFPHPSDDQKKFNEGLEETYSKVRLYLDIHRDELYRAVEKNGEPLRVKKNGGDLPCSLVITKDKTIYVYLNVKIVEKGGAFKSDKRVFDFTHGRNIAKLSQKLFEMDKRRLEFAEREIEILQRCTKENIPRIVKLYDVMVRKKSDHCKQVLFYDHCILGDLGSCLKVIADDQVKLKKILFEVIEALAELHQRNIVHRDIKPGNILLNQNFAVSLGDFGCSSYSGVFERGDGTVIYMDPEVLDQYLRKTEKPAAPHHDIWSFGMVMYALLKNQKGQMPWPWLHGVKNPNNVQSAIKNKKETLFPEPKKEDVWMHICWEALQIDPLKRPTAQQIKERLFLLIYT